MRLSPNLAGVLICGVCGLLDATCFVALGGTFVGLMTGNLILMGVAIGGDVGGLSPALFLYPLGGYALGAFLAGVLFRVRAPVCAARLGLWLSWWLLLGIAGYVVVGPVQVHAASGWWVVTVTAFYLGFQSAVLYLSKRVTITTNVMTSTLTSLLADGPTQGLRQPGIIQKLLAIGGFVGGVVLGAVLADRGAAYAFVVAAALTTVAIGAIVRDQRRLADDRPMGH